MKARWKAALSSAVALVCLCVSAHATDFTVQADELKELGLFKGTQTGYELKREPTRAEAAVMLTRLLGLEKAALANNTAVPFADLEGWETPYVAFLYEKGYTKGTSATTFSPKDWCDADMYSAFLLRALEYSDTAQDFSYETALVTAKEMGLVQKGLYDLSSFCRGDMVGMSYTALALPMKGKDTVLLKKLVEDGVVTAPASTAFIARAQAYQAYYKAFSSISEQTALTVQGAVVGQKKGDAAMETKSENTLTWDFESDIVQGKEALSVMADQAETLTFQTDWLRIGSWMSVKSNGREYAVTATPESCGYRMVPFMYFVSAKEHANGYDVICADGYIAHCMDILGMGASALGIDAQSTGLTIQLSQNVKDGRLKEQMLLVQDEENQITITSKLKMQ